MRSTSILMWFFQVRVRVLVPPPLPCTPAPCSHIHAYQPPYFENGKLQPDNSYLSPSLALPPFLERQPLFQQESPRIFYRHLITITNDVQYQRDLSISQQLLKCPVQRPRVLPPLGPILCPESISSRSVRPDHLSRKIDRGQDRVHCPLLDVRNRDHWCRTEIVHISPPY